MIRRSPTQSSRSPAPTCPTRISRGDTAAPRAGRGDRRHRCLRGPAACPAARCRDPAMTAILLPTTVVGSYPQPDWLIDREKLTHLPPVRVRAQELWRVPDTLARTGA